MTMVNISYLFLHLPNSFANIVNINVMDNMLLQQYLHAEIEVAQKLPAN